MELYRALATLIDPPSVEHAQVAAALALELPTADEHVDVLLFQAYPFASIYLGDDGMLGGEARDRIAGFWRALGADPPHEPDHVAALFAGLWQLAEAERTAASSRQAEAAHRARAVLFWEHVASWLPAFLATLRRVGHPFYVGWADLAESVLADDARDLAPPPHTRSLPVAAAAPDDLDALLAAVLAPARAGFTLTRDDLVRAADELGLGCRAGERRFVLRSVLAQDAGAVLGWLAGEARRQAGVFDRSPIGTARGWATRARASAAWLDARAMDASGAGVIACAAP